MKYTITAHTDKTGFVTAPFSLRSDADIATLFKKAAHETALALNRAGVGAPTYSAEYERPTIWNNCIGYIGVTMHAHDADIWADVQLADETGHLIAGGVFY